jgi:protein phosphatase
MGGAAAGEVASGMAIEALAAGMLGDTVPAAPAGVVDDDHSRLARKLRGAAHAANARIFTEAREHLALSGMGTTMTAVQLWRGWGIIAQVGDSRAYWWRQGAFTQVTRDQSLLNQLLESGQITLEQAKFFEHSNVILQALGVQEEVEVQLSKVALCRGDRLLLCSDGLVGVVSDEEIGAVIGSIDDPADAARILIEMANGAGGPDNITVIVAHVDGDGLPAPEAAEPLAYALWRIDPEPAAPILANRETTGAGFVHAPAELTRARPLLHACVSARELWSMAVILGLVLGGTVTGFLLSRHGVRCRVHAQSADWLVITDGRYSGARTERGDVELRLSPGHHRVALRGVGAPAVEQWLEVESGKACALRFADGVKGAVEASSREVGQ